jgi:hypothetical protein
MKQLIRVGGEIPHTLQFRGERRSLEDLLPRTEPLYIHRWHDKDWVRICFPEGTFEAIKSVKCPCCGGHALVNGDGSVSLDIELQFVSFYVEEVVPDAPEDPHQDLPLRG